MKAKKGLAAAAGVEPRTAKLAAVLVCLLLLPFYFFYGTKTADVAKSVENLQGSMAGGDVHEKVHGKWNVTEEGENPSKEQDLPKEETNLESRTGNYNTTQGELDGKEDKGTEETILETQPQNTTTQDLGGNDYKEDQGEEEEAGVLESQGQTSQEQNNTTQEMGINCDFSEIRTDVCEVRGDVRVHGASSSVLLVSPSGDNGENTSLRIRPYARKWENLTMEQVTELSLSSSLPSDRTPQCNISYTAPAIVFSTAAFQQNFFHEIVDALIPLFLTSYRFHGDVHFLIEDFHPRWIEKYNSALRIMTKHDIINLDNDPRVYCFSHVVVGLNSTMEMGIDPKKSPEGPLMLDFKAMLRRAFGLPREFVLRGDDNARRKPRLLFLSRTGSRVLVNERQVMKMVRRLGFKVVMATPEVTKNLTLMASLVNSCDVLLGVHGAGLTNMVFLPANGTLVQIIPWGEMLYPCRYSYGEPAIGMGLRYIDYEIKLNESSLVKKYPKDDIVFRDPLSIHKKGFSAIWAVFLHQDITLEVPRFREFLSKELAAESYKANPNINPNNR